jgi:multiple sugar transport system substrate-binding protein
MRTSVRARAWLVAVAALSLVLTACGSDADEPPADDDTTTEDTSDEDATDDTTDEAATAEDVTVSFLTHWPPETVALLEAAAADYTADNANVTIEVRAVPFGDLLTTVRAEAGGSSAPTISGIYDLWLPELVRDGIVTAAPDAVATEVQENWTPGVVDAATVDGAVYGVPNEINVYALNYNTRLFEEAGVEGPPETWEELAEAAEALTIRDGDRITQQGLGMINSWAAGVVHPFASLLVSNGGDLVVDGEPVLDSPEALETFQLVEQAVSDPAVTDPTMGTADANTTGPYLDNFVSGNTAMIIMANWWESALRSGMGEDDFQDIATAPIPVGPSGDMARSISYSWMTVVSSQASDAEQAAAWDFLVWLNGPDSGEAGASAMGDILQSMGILPTRTSDIEAFGDRLDTPFLEGYVSVLEDARPFPIVLGGQEFTESLQRHIEEVQFGSATAEQAQEAAQSDAVSILESSAG